MMAYSVLRASQKERKAAVQSLYYRYFSEYYCIVKKVDISRHHTRGPT